MQVDLTPETHVRVTVAKVVAILGVIIVVTASAVTWVDSIQTRIHDHEKDEHLHLDPTFERTHGHVIGTWDLDAALREQRDIVKAWGESVDKLTTTPLHLEDCTIVPGKHGIFCRLRH